MNISFKKNLFRIKPTLPVSAIHAIQNTFKLLLITCDLIPFMGTDVFMTVLGDFYDSYSHLYITACFLKLFSPGELHEAQTEQPKENKIAIL